MSAILKALKKLEQESTANAGVSLSGNIKGRPRRRPGALVVPGLIAFTLCILTGVGVFIFTQNTPDPELAAVLLQDEKPAAAVKASPKNIAQNRGSEIVTQKQKKAVVAEPGFEFSTSDVFLTDNRQTGFSNGIRESLGEKTHETSIVQPTLVYSSDPFTPIMSVPITRPPDTADEQIQPVEEKPDPDCVLQPDRLLRPDRLFQPDIRAGETPGPALPDKPFVEKPVTRKSKPVVDIIEDPDLQLQAISWSADADKRMAIINGKIFREKDRVGSYVIQAINSNEVILSKGPVSGKLVFKIR